jgi:hypothetical protein
MMTLRQLAAEPPTLPTQTAWYLTDLAEARGKQELFTCQRSGEFRLADTEQACPGVGREWIRSLLTDLKAAGEATCHGKGPSYGGPILGVRVVTRSNAGREPNGERGYYP